MKKVTRVQKIKRRQEREKILNELAELEEEKEALLNTIKKNKSINRRRKVVRISKYTITTLIQLIPFFVAAGIIAPIAWCLSAGWPVYLDDIKKYYNYELEYEKNKKFEVNENYVIRSIIRSEDVLSGTVDVYFPWEDNGEYLNRHYRKYTYKSNFNDPEFRKQLETAIINNDYKFIENELNCSFDELQTTNKKELLHNNEAEIKANIRYEDKNDYITYKETNAKNITVTSVEFSIAFLIELLYIIKESWSYVAEMKQIKNNKAYKKILTIKDDENRLKDIDSKILSLKRRLK